MSQGSREERKKKVMEVLNKARSMELQAIHQYMNQHYKLDDMDYGELAANIKLIAIDEMKHAEALAERVKELGGDPTTDLAGGVEREQDIKAIFPFNSEQEEGAIEAYNQFLLVCRENGDSISVKLFEWLIEDEQAHLSYFDNVGDHIKNLGDAYLARMVGTSADTGGETKGFVSSEE
ncbi:MAG: bacterioferritin [Candidatus Syntrophonatronum acetioxidans]|uniref:Bacterioferritin n=1 Tax=Candidatus Syntrophonatronum acetioxidans TaxID=1795816 RepID=A0A424YGS5_9FIRM|nr:MAG: bacterioferritin [Candidatus Syntrophonatronum acetioxidans]